jgi:hypothetical protein
MGLIELEQQRTYDKKEGIASEGEGCASKEILIKGLKQMFQNLETVKQIMYLDLNVERSMLVRQTLGKGISAIVNCMKRKRRLHLFK